MAKGSKKRRDFLWVGNAPGLDFVNTEVVQGGRIVDLLDRPRDFAAWLGHAGFSLRLAPGGRRTLQAGLRLAKAYRATLRERLRQLIQTKRLPPSVILATNKYIAHGGEQGALVRRARGLELRAHWHIESPPDYVVPIAASFAKLITSGELSRVRKCKNPACILFFYDTSKSGTRGWCSLDMCGNKMRMAASRKRRRS